LFFQIQGFGSVYLKRGETHLIRADFSTFHHGWLFTELRFALFVDFLSIILVENHLDWLMLVFVIFGLTEWLLFFRNNFDALKILPRTSY
jgi:hypothetical protein